MTCGKCTHTPEICKPVSGWKIFEFTDEAGTYHGIGICPCCVKNALREIKDTERRANEDLNRRIRAEVQADIEREMPLWDGT